jgi:hypothetical protein
MNKIPEERVLPPFRRAANDSTTQDASAQVPHQKEYEFFGLAHSQASTIGFKIMFAGGNIAAIQYHDIISPLEYDVQGLITIRTLSVNITIKGKNVQELFDYLFENRVVWMKEPDSSFTQVPDGQPEIETIKLEIKE